MSIAKEPKGYWGLRMADAERGTGYSILGQCGSVTNGLAH